MFIYLSDLMERGVIDNTVRGLVDLRLWCGQDNEPLHFIIQGNCNHDIAGCRVSFENKAYRSADTTREWRLMEDLCSHTKSFTAGEMTFSHRAYENDNRKALSNRIYLEFFADEARRILIELNEFDFDISLPQWEMSREEANVEALMGMDSMRAHVDFCSQSYRGSSWLMNEPRFPRIAWDDTLNRAEARAAIYPTVREKYNGQEDAVLSEAYVMGLPDLMGELADEDESTQPSLDAEERYGRDLVLMDFIELENREAIKEAMEHELFRNTSQLTGYLQENLQRLLEKGGNEAYQAERLMRRYSCVVSNILATIIYVQEEEEQGQAEIVAGRVSHIKMRLQQLCDKFIALMPAEDDIHDETESVIHGLDDFLEQTQK